MPEGPKLSHGSHGALQVLRDVTWSCSNAPSAILRAAGLAWKVSSSGRPIRRWLHQRLSSFDEPPSCSLRYACLCGALAGREMFGALRDRRDLVFCHPRRWKRSKGQGSCRIRVKCQGFHLEARAVQTCEKKPGSDASSYYEITWSVCLRC